MEMTRRGFLRGFGALLGAVVAEPVAEVLLPEPRRKIWVVGANLILPTPRRVVFPTFEIVANPEIELAIIKRQRFSMMQALTDKLAAELQEVEDAEVFRQLAMPLRNRLDYSAIGRQVFRVEAMPDGALPSYRKSSV